MSEPKYRVGNGFDVHQFAEGRRLVLGGVEIPYHAGLLGHSDADAVLHALCDAILGALAEGDIGRHFPNTSSRWKDCDSTVFVEQCMRIAQGRNYRVVNADITVMAERPHLFPHVDAICARIAGLLGVPLNCVGFKATTMEKMGFIGRKEGLGAMATVLLELCSGSATPNY